MTRRQHVISQETISKAKSPTVVLVREKDFNFSLEVGSIVDLPDIFSKSELHVNSLCLVLL